MSCRFVVMSDTHFTSPNTPYQSTWWNKSTEMYSERMGEALVELVIELAPDFVIHCGDFIGVCSQESYDLGAGFMDRLGCPWYAVPGNHDAGCQAPLDRMRECI